MIAEHDELRTKWINALTSTEGAYIPTYLERMGSSSTDGEAKFQALLHEALELRAALADSEVKVAVLKAEIEHMKTDRDDEHMEEFDVGLHLNMQNRYKITESCPMYGESYE